MTAHVQNKGQWLMTHDAANATQKRRDRALDGLPINQDAALPPATLAAVLASQMGDKDKLENKAHKLKPHRLLRQHHTD